MVTGAVPLWIILYATILRLEEKDLFAQSDLYSSIPVLMILFVVLAFLGVNLFLEMEVGLQIAKIWLGEGLFCCAIVQIWKLISGTHTFSLGVLLPIPRLGSILQQFVEGTQLGVQAFWLFSGILFIIFGMITVYVLFYVTHTPSKECTVALYAQITIAAVYLLYACLLQEQEVPVYAILGLTVLYIAGVLGYCTVFLGRIFVKDKQGCIRILFAGIAGLCMDEVILLAIDFMKSGGIKGFSQWGVWSLNILYTKTPFSRYPQDGQSLFIELCRLILVVLLLCFLQYIMYRLAEKVICEILDKTLSYIWVKSTARLALLPILVQWMKQTFTQVFGGIPEETWQYIDSILQTCIVLGMGICLINVIQMMVVRKWNQISAIVASLAISLLIIILIPVIISLI
jgi:hypothetical protein